MSQREISAKQMKMLVSHLQKYTSITSLQAQEFYGIMRLGARIFDLRKQGWRIDSEMVPVQTRHGTRKVALYTLVTNGKQNVFNWRAE